MSRLYNIETFPIDRVKDELLPVQIEGFEELTHLARAVLDSCPVVCDSIDESNQPTLNFEDLTEITRPDGDSYYITQASSKHLRSFLVKGGGFEKTWHDEHNNLYSSITLKGNNYTHSMLMESATATDRYIAYGMQESAIIERVLRASRMLREAGISTEYIVGLAEPKEFLIRDNGMAVSQLPVGIDAYKQFLTEKHWRDLGDEDRNFEAYLDISKKMERSTYYISMRAMDSDYRYYDAANFPYARGKVYEQIKEYFGVELDTYNQEDWNKYVDEFFILCATSNLAKLHKLGVAHKYPNALNLTALGGIVDLDSAYGEPLDLGDEPITIEDIANDILMLGQTHDSTVFGMFNGFVSNFRQNVISSYYSNIDKIYDEEDAKQFKLKLGTALYEITEQYEVKKHVAEMLETEVIQEDLMNGITNRWLEANNDYLTEQMEKILCKNLDYYANWLLFDGVLNNYRIRNNVDLDLFKVFLSPVTKEDDGLTEIPDYDTTGTFDQIFSNIIFSDVGNNYNDYVLGQIPELKSDAYKNIELSDKIKEIISTSLAQNYENGFAFDEWIRVKITDILPKFKDQLNQLASEYLCEQVFSEYPTNEMLVTDNKRIILETNGVPFTKILDYIRKNNIEVKVNKPIDEESEIVLAHDYTMSEDAELVQILCEVMLDGWEPQCENPNSDIKLTGLICHSTDNDYMVFVEKKTDGTYRFVINLKNQNLIELLSESSQEEIYRMLRQDKVGNDRLFDVKPYHRSREFSTHLFGISLSEI